MEKDIVPDLFSQIKKDFERNIQSDTSILKLSNSIKNKTATMHDVSLFSRRIGEYASDALRKHITKDVLPDGKMYFNIADRLVRPVLKTNYDLSNDMAQQVQAIIDQKDKIGIKTVPGDWPKERIDALIDSICEDGIEFDVLDSRMDEPVKNVSQSFIDEFVKANAEFRYKSGMNPTIVRTMVGGACKWCRNLAGSYKYPSEIPDGIYQRHDNCRCTVTYKNGGTKQDVWSKARWNGSDNGAERTAAIQKKEAELADSKAKQARTNALRLEYIKQMETDQGMTAKQASILFNQNMKSSATAAVKQQTDNKLFQVSNVSKSMLSTLSRKDLETMATAVYANNGMQNGLSMVQAVQRAKDLMSGNTDAQLRKYILNHNK